MPDGDPISEEELESFLQKLNSWGQTLEPAEQGLLQVVLARANSGEGAEVEGFAISPGGFGDAAGSLLRPLVGGGEILAAKPTVSEGEPWIRGT